MQSPLLTSPGSQPPFREMENRTSTSVYFSEEGHDLVNPQIRFCEEVWFGRSAARRGWKAVLRMPRLQPPLWASGCSGGKGDGSRGCWSRGLSSLERPSSWSNGGSKDFPGSPMIHIPCFHSRGKGSIPGQGTKIPCASRCHKRIKGYHCI